MNDDRVESVRRALARRAGEQINNLSSMVRQKLESSNIQIMQPQYKSALNDDANAP